MRKGVAGMKHVVRHVFSVSIAAPLLAIGSAHAAEPTATPPQASAPVRAECANARVRLDANFPTGAAARCQTRGKRELAVTLTPEDAPPINCSAWYAFRLTPQPRAKRGQRVTITLNYTACGHRYWPKVSEDGVRWTPLPAKDVTVFESNGIKQAQLQIHMNAKPLFVAGQEIIAPSTNDHWLAEKARHPDARRTTLGRSAEGRSIDQLIITSAPTPPREQVVLVGRQHPPEITGAQAMLAFVDTILSDDPIAIAYRARFSTIVVPMLNPDGVARGHWRHATGGLDLNRDWGPFTQPETQLMRDMLKEIADDPARTLRLFLDFHSTRKDVVYTLPDAKITDPPRFAADWLARYQDRMSGYHVERDSSHNPGLPTSKSWVYETYAVPTATFEVGDDTDRALIAKIGRQSALAMMETMLATPAP